MRRICLLLIIFSSIVIFFITAFFPAHNNSDAPTNYVASNLVGENIRINGMGIPEATGSYRKYLIYADKTYICISYSQISENQWETETSARTRVQEWKELALFLNGNVLMTEGDVATLSVDQFIHYMENLYP